METTMLMYFWRRADAADRRKPDQEASHAAAKIRAKQIVPAGNLKGVNPQEVKV